MSILERQLKNNQLFHAYIFEGENDIDNLSFAKEFANEVFKTKGLDLNNETNPDLYVIDNNDNIIDINTIRLLTKDISLSPTNKKIKIYIINNAQNLRDEGSNALLKTLEELKDYNMVIFTTTNSNLMLKTIRSRCQIISLANNKKISNLDMVKLSSIIKDIYQGKLISFYQNKDFFASFKENKLDILNGFLDLFQLVLLYKYKEDLKIGEDVKFNLTYLADMTFDQIENHIELVNKVRTGLKTNINYDLSIEEIIFNIYMGGMLQSERSRR
ncbi:hypothetical protein [Anaerococcus provencensis]|uniref:hypothetical protein n=1 Tax=Anaerococcus provencensis TaxID=938293 RepID=UPI00030B386D|nr:hypothetical protein [Anaerococcus provencensis]